MRILGLALMVGFALVTIALAFINRGSEKIVTTVFLGLAATLGGLITLFIYGAQEPVHRAFSAIIPVDTPTHLPFDMLGLQPDPNIDRLNARDALQKHPELFDASDSNGTILYHHLLQKEIISWIQGKYPYTWEVDFFPMDLGEMHGYMFTSRDVPSRKVTPSEIAQRLAGNKFADLPGRWGPTTGLALPKDTELTITPPHEDKQLGNVGSIVLENPYCTIRIETRQFGGMRGIGTYALVIGLTADQIDRLWTNQYLMIIDASFTRFRTGAPDMPRYRKWVTDIADGLQRQFDEKASWAAARDNYLLRKELPPMPTLPAPPESKKQ